jgi:hypothetical protein
MRGLIVTVVLAVALLLGASAARADTTDIIEPQHTPPTAADGWQAATCEEDEPPPPAEPTVFCSPETKTRFYTQAGGHPPMGFTQYIIRHTGAGPVQPLVEPLEGRILKTLRVDTPPGLTDNPQSTASRCSIADFERVVEVKVGVFAHIPACDPSTVVGRNEVTLVTNEDEVEISPEKLPGVKVPKGFVVKPSEENGTRVPVYNLEPKEGEPALFGFVIGFKKLIFLETDVAWESDYHEAFTIHEPEPSHPFSTLKNRLITFGRAGDGTNLTNPTTCFSPAQLPRLYSTWMRGDSWLEPNPGFPSGSTPVEARVEDSEGNLIQQTGCDLVPFDPTIEVSPGTPLVDSPSPASVVTRLPFIKGGETISESHLRSAKVTLPQGMGLNPSGAKGLLACTDAQFGKGQRVEDNSCPASSRIGTAEIETPPLPPGSLKGDVYVGEQKSNVPTSGDEFRTLVEAKSKRYGVVVRLIGNVSADPKTGQLTAIFDEQEVGPLAGVLPRGLPQVPFESVTLRFDGSRAVLSSPPTCSAAQTTSAMEPWARPETFASPTASFTLSSIPGGGTCPTALAQRPFKPGYTAKSKSTKAGAYSPFRVFISRADGEQELKGVNVTLPEGLAGKLAGVKYCPEAAIAAAAGRSGTAEKAKPSCPSKSKLGPANTKSGTGSDPLEIAGNAYLAGPYKGAPLSLVVITPAVAGPFDLGTVVVRVALFINPRTAQVNPLSDAIPDVFGGVKLDIRSINVNVNRKKFMHNPTNCRKGATAGTLNGGGGDPTDPAAFSSYPVSAPYQASKCRKLKFRPRLHTRLLGGRAVTTRAKHPRLRAVLEMPEGDANVRRSALALPHALFLDQSHIRTVCTRPQLAAHECPKGAVYGHAVAKSLLLAKRLKGPVYMVSSNHELPDLVADLRGQINVQLHGVISSVRGGIKTVFYPVPDAPVSKFVLRMEGGKKGLLQNSTNLCKAPLTSVMNLKAQNGKRVRDNRLPLKVSGCGAPHKKRHG